MSVNAAQAMQWRPLGIEIHDLHEIPVSSAPHIGLDSTNRSVLDVPHVLNDTYHHVASCDNKTQPQ